MSMGLTSVHLPVSWTVRVWCLPTQVFEVNTSDQRDGKHLLAQLQEATQSHQLPRSAAVPPTESQQHTAQASAGDRLLNSIVTVSKTHAET